MATLSFVSRVLPDNLKFCHPSATTPEQMLQVIESFVEANPGCGRAGFPFGRARGHASEVAVPRIALGIAAGIDARQSHGECTLCLVKLVCREGRIAMRSHALPVALLVTLVFGATASAQTPSWTPRRQRALSLEMGRDRRARRRQPHEAAKACSMR